MWCPKSGENSQALYTPGVFSAKSGDLFREVFVGKNCNKLLQAVINYYRKLLITVVVVDQ